MSASQKDLDEREFGEATRTEVIIKLEAKNGKTYPDHVNTYIKEQ